MPKTTCTFCINNLTFIQVQKEYVCRVTGDFTKFSLPEHHPHRVEIDGDDVIVSEPLKVYDMKIGTSIVSRDVNAKDCVTTFKCLSTNGKTSVVSCRPKTGEHVAYHNTTRVLMQGFPALPVVELFAR